jgi:hypothetical protein
MLIYYTSYYYRYMSELISQLSKSNDLDSLSDVGVGVGSGVGLPCLYVGISVGDMDGI